MLSMLSMPGYAEREDNQAAVWHVPNITETDIPASRACRQGTSGQIAAHKAQVSVLAHRTCRV